MLTTRVRDSRGHETLVVSNTAVGFANIPGTKRAGPITQTTGAGLNDVSADGASFTGKKEYSYALKVTTQADPDKFDWSDDGGVTWKGTAVTMVAATPIALNRGITVTWTAKTGHTLNDVFEFTAYPDSLPAEQAVCSLETDQIRFWTDGTVPTASVGKPQNAEDEFNIDGSNDIQRFRAIRVTTDATLQIHYF